MVFENIRVELPLLLLLKEQMCKLLNAALLLLNETYHNQKYNPRKAQNARN